MAKSLRFVSSYAVGIVLGGVVFGGLTYASAGIRTLPAHFANIGIHVNNKTIKTAAEPFIYNSNVYVPISTIAHGLGASVAWNGKTHEVLVNDKNVASTKLGTLNYYSLSVYSGTHTVLYGGKTYIAGFALASIANVPYYIDSAKNTMYFGTVPQAGMPLRSFIDVRDYGDFAKSVQGMVGPDYGWTDGAPKIDGILYSNANSIVWANSGSNSQVPGVMYNLKGNYSLLTGSFGLDDASDAKEEAQLTILGDGKQLYQSPWQAQGAPAAPVSVDVSHVKLLTIEFSVMQNSTKKVYTMGQALPSSLRVDIDFADVRVH